MKIGYAFWGFISDYKIKGNKEISTPDGNAFYSWSIFSALLEAGHEVFRMMPNRDEDSFNAYGKNAFGAFAKEKRNFVYSNYKNYWPKDLDILLLEWRFPIPGRNCDVDMGSKNFQPDLLIQKRLIEKYSNGKTKIIIFDLDYKLTEKDEREVKPLCVLETSNKPKKLFSPRISVEIPFDFDSIMEFSVDKANKENAFIYVGNRYERDNSVEKYLVPLAKKEKINVNLYGNWLESGRDSKERWPFFNYNTRIATRFFRGAYKNSGATLLLAKDEYTKRGFMTARILEAIFFGTIPIGVSDFYNIKKYLPDNLIANDAYDVAEIIKHSIKDYRWRKKIINELRVNLSFMDCRNFVKTIEDII